MKKRLIITKVEQTKHQTSLIKPVLDQLPPQAPEVETAVLSALISESKAIEKISLEPDDFYFEDNRLIFQAISQLQSKHRPIDIATAIEELKAMMAGNIIPHLIEIFDNVSSTAHIEYHAAIIKEKAMRRKLITLTQDINQQSFDDSEDVEDTMEHLEKSFTELRSGGSASEFLNMQGAIKRTVEYLAKIQEKRENGESTTISTGLKALDDRLSGGWSAPDLIILGGRPSMGKTQFALHFAQSAAKNNHRCLFISIEMTVEQLVMRILTEDERLSYYNMKTGQMDNNEWQCIDEKISEFENEKLFIADNYNVRNLNTIKALSRKLKRLGELDLLIIDYLQLIKTNQSFGTRDLEIGHITGDLKNLAKELNIPIILLAQLSRPPKGTSIQIPILSDLRESGNIEQDADKVIFPHRPSYYNTESIDSSGRSWKNRGMLIIGKDREGVKDEKIYFRTDDRFKKIWDDKGGNDDLPFMPIETPYFD